MITSQRLLQIFVVFGIVYCLLLLTGNEDITWYLKPFLLPFLFYAVVKSTGFKTKKWLMGALLLSWIGDCILMFTHKGEQYFIFGLVAFLMAHILFIVLFAKQGTGHRSFKKVLFWVGLVAATIYLAGMLSFLLPGIKDESLQYPVAAYALIITIMLKMALKGTFDWNGTSKYSIFIGAALFVTSDSILAINKFHSALPLASFWIMLTYLMAQFYITSGVLKLNPQKD